MWRRRPISWPPTWRRNRPATSSMSTRATPCHSRARSARAWFWESTMTDWQISPDVIAEHNKPLSKALAADYGALGEQLARRGVDIEGVTKKVAAFHVAVPSWGVGTGGTRFARFPGIGEPRNILEKLDDCCVIHQLSRATPRVSLHIPWDKPHDPAELKQYAAARGLGFDAMNSNTFQDQRDQKLSYKFGSLSHTDAATRAQ